MGGCPLRSNVSPGTQVAIVRPRLLNPPQAKLAPVHAIGDTLRRYQGRSEHWTCRVGGPAAAAMHLAVPLALPANVACRLRGPTSGSRAGNAISGAWFAARAVEPLAIGQRRRRTPSGFARWRRAARAD